MPITLKSVLAQYNISQGEWADAIGVVAKGKPFSRTAASLLLNWGQWPKLTPAHTIRGRTETYLRLRGVPDEALQNIWTIDKSDPARDANLPGRTTHEARAQQRANVQLNNNPTTDDFTLPEAEMLSQSARKHFKLFRDPFVDDVQTATDVFLSSEQRYIREAMFITAKHGGFLAVVGESGAGKTTLRRDLIDRIARENLPITIIQPRIIDKGRLTAGSICDAIIADISRETPRSSLENKARQIERLLIGSSRSGNAHVLMIEEAHDLSIKTLKFLKRFWELEDGFRKLLGIILVGQPELKAALDERVNWEAREVIRRCEVAELLPLNGNLEEYIALKFKRLDIDHKRLFDDGTYDAIRERLTHRHRGTNKIISMMYPLVVNNCITKALNLAAEIGADKVNAEIISEV